MSSSAFILKGRCTHHGSLEGARYGDRKVLSYTISLGSGRKIYVHTVFTDVSLSIHGRESLIYFAAEM